MERSSRIKSLPSPRFEKLQIISKLHRISNHLWTEEKKNPSHFNSSMIALSVLGSFKQTNQKKKKKHLFILLIFKLHERDKMKIINLLTLSLKPDIPQHLAISHHPPIPFHSSQQLPNPLFWSESQTCFTQKYFQTSLKYRNIFNQFHIVKYLGLFYFFFFPVLLSYSWQETPFNSNQKFIFKSPSLSESPPAKLHWTKPQWHQWHERSPSF